jgi:hypothetical protein
VVVLLAGLVVKCLQGLFVGWLVGFRIAGQLELFLRGSKKEVVEAVTLEGSMMMRWIPVGK